MRFDITALYCCLDDFTKIYEDWECHHLIGKTCQRRRKGKLSLSELLLIMILFHTGNSRNFKTLRGGPVFSTSFLPRSALVLGLCHAASFSLVSFLA